MDSISPVTPSDTNLASEPEYHYCGLKNLGETCYSNACLQALYSLNKVRDHLLSFHKPDPARPFQTSLSDLFRQMSQPEQQFIFPVEFNEQFRRAQPEFVLGTQHDAQEFLAFLLAKLHQEVNQTKACPTQKNTLAQNKKEAWTYQQTYVDNSRYSQLFLGQIESSLIYQCCGHQSMTWSAFWQLQLNLQIDPSMASGKVISLNDCIRQFTAQESLQDECAPSCGSCGQRVGSIKKQTISEGPLYLIIHLKRFRANGQKIHRKIILDERLSLANRYYNLVSCVMHDGSANKGHYTTLYCHTSEQWVLFNDSKVTEHIDKQKAGQMMHKLAYIAFYRAVLL